jgi:hypothetical protein
VLTWLAADAAARRRRPARAHQRRAAMRRPTPEKPAPGHANNGGSWCTSCIWTEEPQPARCSALLCAQRPTAWQHKVALVHMQLRAGTLASGRATPERVEVHKAEVRNGTGVPASSPPATAAAAPPSPPAAAGRPAASAAAPPLQSWSTTALLLVRHRRRFCHLCR